jgi:hypothetical protein
LAGCAVTPSAEDLAKAQRFTDTMPSCIGAEQCERMWAAARRWVLDNASFKIQTYSADYMETFNNQDVAETDTWARVTKEPGASPTEFSILIEIGCNNPLGCSLSPLADARQRFNDYVNARK